jgi:Fur family transcriptional regulator, ferric uptake regulator
MQEAQINKKNEALALLENSRLKKTPNRISVLSVFLENDHALSYQEIEAALPENFDRVTLYRTLHTFEAQGITHKVVGETTRYALCSGHCNEHRHEDNHLHFHCTRCGKVFCLDDHLIPDIQLPRGYVVNDIDMIVQGVCRDCVAAS